MNKFSDYIKTDVKNYQNVKPQLNEAEKVDLEELVNKYSQLTHEELMQEFLKESNKLKQNGGLTDKQISEMEQVLKPHLSVEQQNMFDDLMTEIK